MQRPDRFSRRTPHVSLTALENRAYAPKSEPSEKAKHSTKKNKVMSNDLNTIEKGSALSGQKQTPGQLEGKSPILILAVFGALLVANMQPVSAQDTYKISTLAERFSYPVDGLSAIADNGICLGYAQGSSVLCTRDSALPLDVPAGLIGAGYTGLNASLTTAGSGYLADFSDTVAFVREAGGNFRFLSFPAGSYPATTGINDNGDVVGYTYDQNFNAHGFLADQKGIHPIDIPGVSYVQPMGINASGVIVGFYLDQDYNSHSFIMNNKGVSEWTLPGATSPPSALCINNQGAIGGAYSVGTNTYGFVYKGGKVSTIDYANPNAADSFTNNAGGIVEVFVKLSSSPVVTGINDRGDIVGYTADVYKATDPSYPYSQYYVFETSFWGTALP